MSKQRVDMLTYFNLYVPALDWIMHGTSIKGDDALLDDIFAKCRDKKNKYVHILCYPFISTYVYYLL